MSKVREKVDKIDQETVATVETRGRLVGHDGGQWTAKIERKGSRAGQRVRERAYEAKGNSIREPEEPSPRVSGQE